MIVLLQAFKSFFRGGIEDWIADSWRRGNDTIALFASLTKTARKQLLTKDNRSTMYLFGGNQDFEMMSSLKDDF